MSYKVVNDIWLQILTKNQICVIMLV
jgi:hypothetical protein